MVWSPCFIGLTQGWYSRAHRRGRGGFDQIRDETGYIVPEDPSGELQKLLKTLSD